MTPAPIRSAPERPVLHLVCNAHLDPVWLWPWEEGAGEALSTFRVAAEFCERDDGFVFNHNEAVLYEWVEVYDPELFARIQRLVADGRWHVMGGWYLQPDGEMPAGESLVRQILTGHRYFLGRFGVEPRIAMNVDPFGHSRGLVQILARSGYTGYLFCRPDVGTLELPGDEFVWEGFDGSRVLACRAAGYGNQPGEAGDRVKDALHRAAGRSSSLLLWGIGNHGGGPSREDLQAVNSLRGETSEVCDIRHSTPEAFFNDLAAETGNMPVFADALAGGAGGHYASMARLKQKHRRLEAELWRTEKMVTQAWVQGLMPYPQMELAAATRDLLFSQFHDSLPGSSIPAVEEQLMDKLGHGREELACIRTRAFFALTAGGPPADEGDLPLCVYNPHPYPVRHTFDVELSLLEWTAEKRFTPLAVYRDGERLPSQVEQHASNHNIDWRKRVVFSAECPPSSTTRFICRREPPVPTKPQPSAATGDGEVRVRTPELEVTVSATTGLLDRYRVHGVDILKPGAARALALTDNPDPWAFNRLRWDDVTGAFELLSADASRRVSGLARIPADRELPSVRVIEDGAIRTVVEAILGFQDSSLCLRYRIPKTGTELGIEARVYWNEKDTMLKLALPLAAPVAAFLGQTAYGTQALPCDGTEVCAQQWVAARMTDDQALTCTNNGTYACDLRDSTLRLTLLRSPSYSGMPFGHNPHIVQTDRFTPRQAQGEHLFDFFLNAGPADERLAAVDLEAQFHHEPPMALPFSPDGRPQRPGAPAITLSNTRILLTAMKRAEDGDDLVLRLFNPGDSPASTRVVIPERNTDAQITVGGLEIATLRVSDGAVQAVDLMERPPQRRRGGRTGAMHSARGQS